MTKQEKKSDSFQKNIVDPEEIISRFIFSSRYYSSTGVKHSAFLPPNDCFDISVYRIQNLSEEEIWEIDDKYVSGMRGKQSLGRADFKLSVLHSINLTFDPNGIPHPRHANICFSESMTKETQRLIAMKLAEVSVFVPRK